MTFVDLSETFPAPPFHFLIFILGGKKSTQSYIFPAEPLLADRIVTKMEFGDKTT